MIKEMTDYYAKKEISTNIIINKTEKIGDLFSEYIKSDKYANIYINTFQNNLHRNSCVASEEGFVYEVISKIQTMRKDADFEVMDHIRVSIDGNDKIAGIVKKNESIISAKVLADEMVTGETLEASKEWNVNGENVTISISRK